ncbi:MAG: UDP-N-acetylmuramoyl-L-alanyl-D-glutamate--2,6-diaminopimelate ligase [Rubricoccaceae bacterium]|nr:UDP-N-acetylmuramoyl-L-alanyl-D-glutamate--2,6-diaminopimelate ligase [Rubricoccaceae bacterium]
MSDSSSFFTDSVVPPQSLADLLAPLRAAGLLVADVHGADGIVISRLAEDSRQVGPDTLFIARKGDHSDGHLFIDKAVQQGAVAAIVDADWLREAAVPAGEGSPATSPLGKGERLPSAVFVPVSDTRAALAGVANAFYGYPSSSLDILGVTGTNGKTTTAFLIYRMMKALGQKTGLVGTIENRVDERVVYTNYTTPEPIELNTLLRGMVDAGCTMCAMEVSSHGLALKRVAGQQFRAGVFTNLTHDHLDFHRTPALYAEAKKLLFDGLDRESVAVVNRDDSAWELMVRDTSARVLTYGTSAQADIHVEVVDNALDGLVLRLDGSKEKFQLAGQFNAMNLTAAYAVGRDLGYTGSELIHVLREAKGVPGRFETFKSSDGVLAIVDYAHTPDALDNVLRNARQMMDAGSLHVVFGCGGDRDRSKRPEMARIAERHADQIVLTSDNPRTEDPLAILSEIEAGLRDTSRSRITPDRAEAIASTIHEANPGDVIVVAGKGHEDYQIIGTEKRPFDDRQHVQEVLSSRNR